VPGVQPVGADVAVRLAVERLATAAPRLGRTRLVCVDGPAGSGKTTLAGRLADAVGATVVHMDDLYAGWTLTGAFARLAAGVLRPLAEGRPGSYARYDWKAGRFEDERTAVAVPEVLVVEGCGSAPRAVDAWAVLRIWVEAPQPVRLSRGIARDGAGLEPEWRRWQGEEARLFAAEDTRARADVVVDGTAPRPSPSHR
jgi:uridine kinase